ncbi:hypothetical protein M409DRAFT_20043 [Zasmidium cellare ATCC 36951]|uniref:F-box domain-containing protein n=1 Tax=Zasmidium cellare ATCC 36951 TaxID=1080233 RepID=A0A6A6CUZ6_ZASCE|nr:uncharacterized protein M409DRAFT_20043 [Zasmidium cellare ATCC 36951]KAF2169629.1 hypothetical protein M409DRAFT_20043 [Zasmidium cellare ATCC 36951]
MTAPELPHEILSLFAKSVSEIYSTVWVQSPSESDSVFIGRDSEPRKKVGLTQEQLDEITTGPQPWRQARRAAIRHIFYWVAVPHWLEDRTRERQSPDRNSEQHSYDNPLRRENDEAFSTGVQALFEYLSSPSWAERSALLTLSVVLQAEKVHTTDMKVEPGTGLIELNKLPLAWYTGTLRSGTTLKPVSCVRAVEFPRVYATANGEQNMISLPAQVRILSACGDCDALVEANLFGSYYMGNQISLLTQKRNDTAKVLHLLPKRIQTLHLEWCDEISPHVFEQRTQPQYQLAVRSDALSRALHSVSMQLCELYIVQLDMTSDFFRLSKDEHQSTVLWPHLETLRLTFNPTATPTGQPLIYEYWPDGEDGGAMPLTSWQQPGPKRLEYVENGDSSFSIVPGFFDDLYASAGYAAQKMPKITSLLLSWEEGDTQDLELKCRGNKWVLELYSFYGYSPCQEVLDAWQIPEGKMKKRLRVLETEFDSWPPSPLGRE